MLTPKQIHDKKMLIHDPSHLFLGCHSQHWKQLWWTGKLSTSPLVNQPNTVNKSRSYCLFQFSRLLPLPTKRHSILILHICNWKNLILTVLVFFSFHLIHSTYFIFLVILCAIFCIFIKAVSSCSFSLLPWDQYIELFLYLVKNQIRYLFTEISSH